MAFSHLHVHTEFSLLDGMVKIDEMLEKAKECGMHSVAITDHGNLYGAIEFYKKTKTFSEKTGYKINPIIGTEFYVATQDMERRDTSLDKKQFHLTVLAENYEGYKNLCELSSIAFTKGFYYKPRIDLNILKGKTDGLICLSGCIQGEVQQKLLNIGYDAGKESALKLKELFGENNFFLEIQNQGLDEEEAIKEDLKNLSKELNIPLVATNDVHYLNEEDSKAHEVLLCIQSKKTMNDDSRMKFPNSEFYFKSEEEMQILFPDIPEAITNTEIIANRCDLKLPNIDKGLKGEKITYYLPPFEIKGEEENEDAQKKLLKELCEEGLIKRYGNKAEKHKDRLYYELDIIEKTGFVEYFLIVWDFIRYAKENGIIVGPGRGSAAGSIVSYSLFITEIDPIRWGLLFERFLTEDRVSMPDIDIDFDDRDKMIEYVISKYGEDKVSQIITFGKLKEKAVINDVSRVFQIDLDTTRRITKKFPTISPFSFKQAYETGLIISNEEERIRNSISSPSEMPNLKQIINQIKIEYEDGKPLPKYKMLLAAQNDDRKALSFLEAIKELLFLGIDNRYIRNVIETSLRLEGLVRNPGVHAAAVVISDKPITSHLPIAKNKNDVSTQFTKDEVEELGLLKMDFLGLANLSIIKDALALIKKRHGIDIDLLDTDYKDKNVYKLMSEGNTDGVFQLESPGMKNFFKQLKPETFEDVTAGIALFRPGPMDSIPKYISYKNDPSKISYLHEKLIPILSMTHGCLIYQEQVMQIVRDLAGYSVSRSDVIRKAMGKKKKKVMDKEREVFIYGCPAEGNNPAVEGCIKNGIDEDIAIKIWEDMASFAEYAFNKSHAASYAVLAYQTAFLKAYYPKEFLASIMSNMIGKEKPEKFEKYIINAEEMGIKVIPPNVLKSDWDFSITDEGNIIYGLGAVKNVSKQTADEIILKRGNLKDGASFQDFIEELDVTIAGKKSLEALILSGATENCFPGNRNEHFTNYPKITDIQKTKIDSNRAQISLFEIDSKFKEELRTEIELPGIPDYTNDEKRGLEIEYIGLPFTPSPINNYQEIIDKISQLNDSVYDYKSRSNKPVYYMYSNEFQDGIKYKKGRIVRTVVYLNSVREITTKKGDKMAFFVGEDKYGNINFVDFPSTYKKDKEIFDEFSRWKDISELENSDEITREEKDNVFVVKGTLDTDFNNNPQIIVKTLTPLKKVEGKV